MKNWHVRFAVLTAAAVLAALGAAGAAEDLEISDIMKKVNGGKGLSKAVGKDLQAQNIEWDAVAKKTKEIHEAVSMLTKNDPPKGDKKSWEKLTKEYISNAKALNEACEKKDKAAATAALRKMGGACMACHTAHRPT